MINIFFTKILMLEITSRNGLIGWYKKYQIMKNDIQKSYGDLNYTNYCKFINIK